MRKICLFGILFLGSLLCFAQSTTYPLDKGATSCADSSDCTTPAINTTGSNLVIVMQHVHSGTVDAGPVTSTPSCSWHDLTEQKDGNAGNLRLSYSYNCANSSVTFKCDPGAATVSCLVQAFVGSVVFEGESGALFTSATGSFASGNLTLSSVNDLVFTAWDSFDSTYLGIAAGPTMATALLLGTSHCAGGVPCGYAFGPMADFTPCGTGTCMTSDTAPSPYVASASTEQNPAWSSFDGVLGSTGWLGNNSGSDWIRLYQGSGTSNPLYFYTFRSMSDVPARTPVTWTEQGSSDSSTCTSTGTSWNTLDTESSITGWGAGEMLPFGSSDHTSYKCFRLIASANDGGNPYTGVAEIYYYKLGTFGGTTINPTWTLPSGTTRGAVVSAAFTAGTPPGNRRRIGYVTNQ